MEHPRQILARYQITAQKSLGQNFLVDQNIARKIVQAADLSPKDSVLEIGPGIGILTDELVGIVDRVIAVEIDGRLEPILKQKFGQDNHVRLVFTDFLSLSPDQYAAGPFKVVANIPYYITGAIIRHLLDNRPRPEMIVLTVQEEVAERLAAQPGNMSLIAVAAQTFGKVEKLFAVRSGSFWPAPDVDSAVVRISQRAQALLAEEDELRYFSIVRAGFSQKRKQLQKNLRQLGLDRTTIDDALHNVGISGRRRAETLSVEEWIALSKALV